MKSLADMVRWVKGWIFGKKDRAPAKRQAREGAEVYAGDQKVGVLTSGGFSPTLGRPIAMAYVTSALAAPGTALHIDVRGKRLAAAVTQMPFVPHRYHR